MSLLAVDPARRPGGAAEVLARVRLLRGGSADSLAAAVQRGIPVEDGERAALLDSLGDFALPVSGHEGYRKAEVTGGGVALSEIDPVTMESRRRPGLFLCGELLDAFGPIGGYNFLWAWVTGRAAGLGARAQIGP